jgi:hypothetical protein
VARHTKQMNTALKEWNSVVNALGAGRQILLLRKGGIVEARQGFQLRHPEFLLFPTWEHEHARYLQVGAPADPDPGNIPIRYWARAEGLREAPPVLALLRGLPHIWNDTFLQMRMNYRPDLPLYAVLLRVYRLAHPQTIPDRPSYAGCKSWVHLTEELDTGGSEPVLPDGEFGRQRTAVERLLQVPHVQ